MINRQITTKGEHEKNEIINGIRFKESDDTVIIETDDKLSQNMQLKSFLYNFLNVQKIRKNGSSDTLLQAGCGTGKTYAIINYCKEHIVKDSIIIFAVPTVSLAAQAGKEYGIPFYIGTHKLKDIGKYKIIVSVYDKVEEVYNRIINTSKNTGIRFVHLIIDEAHQLCNDINFRSKAVNCIRRTKENIINNNIGNVLFMTGTGDDLLPMVFDNYISVVCKNTGKENKIFIDYVKCSKEEALKDNIFGNILLLCKQDTLPVVQIEDKELTSYYIRLAARYGMKGICINSDDNKNTSMTVEDNGNIMIENSNKIYDSIMNSGRVPENYKGKRIDVIFTTSVINSGVNIIGTDGDRKLVPVYVVKDLVHMNHSKIIQFLARFRNSRNDCHIIMNETQNEIGDFISSETVIKNLSYEVEKVYQMIKDVPDRMREEDYINYLNRNKEDIIKKHFQIVLETEMPNGQSDNVGNILFYNEDTGQIEKDPLAFAYIVNRKMDNQFYYHKNYFAAELMDKTGAEVIIREPVNTNISKMYKMKDFDSNIVKEQDDKFISLLKSDKSLVKQIESGNISDERIIDARINGLATYKEIMDVKNTSGKISNLIDSYSVALDYNGSIDMSSENNRRVAESMLEKLKKDAIKDNAIFMTICSVVKNEKPAFITEDKFNCAMTICENNKKTLAYIKQALSIGVSQEQIRKDILNHDEKELASIGQDYLIQYNNRRVSEFISLKGVFGKIQEYIISFALDKKRMHFIQKTCTKAIVTKITDAVNEHFGYTGKRSAFTAHKMLGLLKRIFTIRNLDDKDSYHFMVTGLRMGGKFVMG